jgi:hypothetical protein
MSNRIPTRHWSETGPTEGYVYLAVRGRTDYSIKIGSTRTTPAERLSQTPSCTQQGFLLACATTAARELEYFLQLKYRRAGKSLKDLEHFDLTMYDVLELALWFDGYTFMTQDESPHDMTLVNKNGEPPETLEEMAKLIGDAALETHLAAYRRMRAAGSLEGRRRR